MILLIATVIWIGIDLIVFIIQRGTGFHISVTMNIMGTWHLLGWQWSVVSNQRDDINDHRVWPTILKDEGFSVQPLCFRVVINRVRKISDGYGPVISNETDRERMREKDRKRVNL